MYRTQIDFEFSVEVSPLGYPELKNPLKNVYVFVASYSVKPLKIFRIDDIHLWSALMDARNYLERD